jgi:hypothetical protein
MYNCKIHNLGTLKKIKIPNPTYFLYFYAIPMTNHNVYYKEKSGDSSQIQVIMNDVNVYFP